MKTFADYIAGLKCGLVDLATNYEEHVIVLDLPEGHCTHMSGAIDLAMFLDPDVCMIPTISPGDKYDVIYVKADDGSWKAETSSHGSCLVLLGGFDDVDELAKCEFLYASGMGFPEHNSKQWLSAMQRASALAREVMSVGVPDDGDELMCTTWCVVLQAKCDGRGNYVVDLTKPPLECHAIKPSEFAKMPTFSLHCDLGEFHLVRSLDT